VGPCVRPEHALVSQVSILWPREEAAHSSPGVFLPLHLGWHRRRTVVFCHIYYSFGFIKTFSP